LGLLSLIASLIPAAMAFFMAGFSNDDGDDDDDDDDVGGCYANDCQCFAAKLVIANLTGRAWQPRAPAPRSAPASSNSRSSAPCAGACSATCCHAIITPCRPVVDVTCRLASLMYMSSIHQVRNGIID
jgi:hypothetical protein